MEPCRRLSNDELSIKIRASILSPYPGSDPDVLKNLPNEGLHGPIQPN